jgi:FkbM family methyltransferase
MAKIKIHINFLSILKRMLASVSFIKTHPLVKGNKLFAFYRYLHFHIYHILSPTPRLYPYIEGIRYYARPGMAGIIGNIYTGLADFEEMAFLLHLLRKDDLFVDVGANAGAYSLLAAGVCSANALAIEPIPSTYAHLVRNIEVNELTSLVKTLNLGIGATRTELKFTNNLDAMNRVAFKDHDYENAIVVQVEPLDSLLAARAPTLMKVDVEGYELEVFKGAARVLGDPALLGMIVEMNGLGRCYGSTCQDVHNYLAHAGFRPYGYSPSAREVSALHSFHSEKFNTIYIRDIAAVVQRVQNAKSFTVLGTTL